MYRLLTTLVFVGVCCFDFTLSIYPQYHIQSEEGDIKFFKYSTSGGQYRKEIRLEDGTVVGTYGWEDNFGTVRLYDYIADAQGYRILEARKISRQKLDTLQSFESLPQVGEEGATVVVTAPLQNEMSIVPLDLSLVTNSIEDDGLDVQRKPGRVEEESRRRGRRLGRKRRRKRLGFTPEVIPYQETLLLQNQYPTNSERPYLRVLAENSLVHVPLPSHSETTASPTASLESAAVTVEGSTPSELPASVLLTKIKASKMIHITTPPPVEIEDDVEESSTPTAVTLKPSLRRRVRVRTRQPPATRERTDGSDHVTDLLEEAVAAAGREAVDSPPAVLARGGFGQRTRKRRPLAQRRRPATAEAVVRGSTGTDVSKTRRFSSIYFPAV